MNTKNNLDPEQYLLLKTLKQSGMRNRQRSVRRRNDDDQSAG